MPRFVILQHVTPPGYREGTHFDLMLEDDGHLLTWSLPQAPRAGISLTATRLPDHRLVYLDYEGPVSGDRGEVTRVDGGEFRWLERGPDPVVVRLIGKAVYELTLSEHDGVWTARFTSTSPPSPE
jgi:hypothetical protein